MENTVKIFQSVNDLAKFALEKLAKKIGKVPKEKFYTVALSGGTTPKQLFEYLALNGQKAVNWNRILFFWCDERCVFPDSDESNYRMVRLHLLEKLGIPENHIFRIYGEANPDEEAQRYSQILTKNIDLKNGLPCFDLILLGLGEDGHTASIFPGNTQLFKSEQLCEAVKHPQTGQYRVTLTGRVINNATNVVFLVTGSGKAEIVFNVLTTVKNDFPASLVSPAHGRLTWLLDKDAAIGLL